jgi:hypothetical protein
VGMMVIMNRLDVIQFNVMLLLFLTLNLLIVLNLCKI